ncbi:hypothetical protein CAMGR0001_1490 [Campylobacter gracilis RM3268]|uniref:Uncharacterized protein n=1 Tax=Campylobacter gracilis RM3268 TaxID=553220 RepID=C8PJU0_9BACT|nr:hypothetical protein CAMGR0001_1490 [Campylobacter gracilis RM3268]
MTKVFYLIFMSHWIYKDRYNFMKFNEIFIKFNQFFIFLSLQLQFLSR